MKRRSYQTSSPLIAGIFITVLLAPQAAFALDVRFVLEGVLGVFRGLQAGQSTDAPPAEIWLSFTPENTAPEGLYSRAPICELPDCGFISVDASGRTLTTPARFHGVNGGWQLLITSPTPAPAEWPLLGTLMYCPGYEVSGDPERCPAPGPDTQPRSGWLTPPPHGDPGDSVPGPLPWLGVAASFRYSRKLRRRLMVSKRIP